MTENENNVKQDSVSKHIKNFVSKNLIMFIAAVLAAITCIFVPIDNKYIDYFDFKTLSCLFCVLAIVCALKNIKFFTMLAQKIIIKFNTAKKCVLAIVYITFIGSMFMANDMALLTFLPLGYLTLKTTDKSKYIIFTFVMQNIAANLGGMLTPFGNPQNLYIYTKFNIPTFEFIEIMALPFLIAIYLITTCCLFFVKADKISIRARKAKVNKVKATIYLILFAYSILMVFRVIPYWTGIVLVIITLLIMDRKALLKVDYPLLLTFVFFFIFAGNMARISFIKDVFTFFLQKNTFISGIVSCQFISNVPTAILLSQFTDNYKELLYAVNIGGTGTLIASLASLITYREYTKHYPEKRKEFIKYFSIMSFSFLFVLSAIIILL